MGANHSMWSRSPLLGTIPGKNYSGRIFIEVWDQGVRLVSDNNDSLLFQGALRALKSSTYKKGYLNISGEPTTGHINGQVYLGCIVIEQWEDQVLVGNTGSPQLLERAIQTLEKF